MPPQNDIILKRKKKKEKEKERRRRRRRMVGIASVLTG
jgi:cell division protein FtsB